MILINYSSTDMFFYRISATYKSIVLVL